MTMAQAATLKVSSTKGVWSFGIIGLAYVLYIDLWLSHLVLSYTIIITIVVYTMTMPYLLAFCLELEPLIWPWIIPLQLDMLLMWPFPISLP